MIDWCNAARLWLVRLGKNGEYEPLTVPKIRIIRRPVNQRSISASGNALASFWV